MIKTKEIKQIAFDLGANLCGIASIDRFNNAPEGFRPTDLYSKAKSVIVLAKKLPESIFYTKSYIPYSFADVVALKEIFRITFEFSIELEKYKIIAVPVPSEPYEYWDKETMTGKGILSLKHAGYLAGLGVMGRNSLLNNPKFGNLIKLGAVITNADLEADPIIAYDFCSDKCNLCIDHCPSGALSKDYVLQKDCRLNSEGLTKKGAPITISNSCMKICPNRAGWKMKL
ncbi:MAG: epoxyqueuosine reductase [Candidatus Caldatribacteriota bacterium]